MSAEVLREAARLMRERAEVCGLSTDEWYSASEVKRALIARDGPETTGMRVDAEHIASWSPVVALAVAEALEDAAYYCDEAPEDYVHPATSSVGRWIAVARTYLGRTA